MIRIRALLAFGILGMCMYPVCMLAMQKSETEVALYDELGVQKGTCEMQEWLSNARKATEECQQAKKRYETLANDPWLKLKKTAYIVTEAGLCICLLYGGLSLHNEYCIHSSPNIVRELICGIQSRLF